MLNNLTFEEYTYWLAYYSVEPFPEERSDYRNALLAATFVNIQSKKSYEIEDFMFDFWGKTETVPETQEQLLQKVAILKELFKGKDLRQI